MMENVQTKIMKFLLDKKWKLATAESCTGGLLVSSLIDVPGASNVISESFVTYSIDAKCALLDVDPKTIEEFGVASMEVSLAMATGLANKSGADVCIATTGEAGSSLIEKSLAFCYYTIIVGEESYSFITETKATRNDARSAFVETICEKLLAILKREE